MMVMREMDFFVYLLQSGYIGMTYDPSRRQKEHEINRQTEQRVSYEINKRKDSDNPIPDVDNYRKDERSKSHAKYFDERDKSGFTCWDRDVSNHWKKSCRNGSKKPSEKLCFSLDPFEYQVDHGDLNQGFTMSGQTPHNLGHDDENSSTTQKSARRPHRRLSRVNPPPC